MSLAAGVFATAVVGLNYLRRTEQPRALSVETVARGLAVPWSIAFLNGSEAVFTERAGNVKYIDLDAGRVEDVGRLGVRAVGEGGLLGVEVMKGRSTHLYLYHTYVSVGRVLNKVVKASFNGGLDDVVDILTSIPGGNIHNGGRLKIGPDGKLYITAGEGGVPELSQDLNSLGGKILRINPDGTTPGDNPFNTPVYAYGLRNPQGLAWRKPSNTLYCTDHGPSGEGLRFAHDEVNLVVPGGNYGWPYVVGDEEGTGFRKPLLHSGLETWAPSGCCFYNSDLIGEWTGSFFFACLRGRQLHRLLLDEAEKRLLSRKNFTKGFTAGCETLSRARTAPYTYSQATGMAVGHLHRRTTESSGYLLGFEKLFVNYVCPAADWVFLTVLSSPGYIVFVQLVGEFFNLLFVQGELFPELFDCFFQRLSLIQHRQLSVEPKSVYSGVETLKLPVKLCLNFLHIGRHVYRVPKALTFKVLLSSRTVNLLTRRSPTLLKDPATSTSPSRA
jgi:glucose/arabinose dehydrogenase